MPQKRSSDLAAEEVHAVFFHQCERAFRIDIILVIPSHVDGRRERASGFGVIPSPVVAHVDVQEVHRYDVASL
jgi:hypothetical protein